MYQYHCWINIDHQKYANMWEYGEIEMEEFYQKMDTLVQQLINRIELCPGPLKSQYRIIRGNNAMKTLHFSVFTNHYDPDPHEVLEWIRNNCPYSYGLLYIWDDENEVDYDRFVVYRLARNEIKEYKDTLLSPCLDTLEKGYFKE